MTPKEEQQHEVVATTVESGVEASTKISSSSCINRRRRHFVVVENIPKNKDDDSNDDDGDSRLLLNNNNNNNNNEEEEEEETLFSFGVIADVQWADIDDGMNYAKTVKRCYRGSFDQLQKAVQFWNSYNKNTTTTAAAAAAAMVLEKSNQQKHKKPLLYIAQLGDLIDGQNKDKKIGSTDLAESERVLSLALEQLNNVRPSCPSINLIGNHELYNFNRSKLVAKASKKIWMYNGDSEYYSFDIVVAANNDDDVKESGGGWRVIVLDPYQISLIGHSTNDPRRLEAVELLRKENPNISPDGADGSNWFDGLTGDQRRFVPYNGGFGLAQLQWFEKELIDCQRNKQRVIIMSHIPIHPNACEGQNLVWDYDQALNIISKFSSSSSRSSSDQHGEEKAKASASNTTASSITSSSSNVVAAVLCGHDHKGEYFYDQDHGGIHHCTFMSPLNKGSKGSAYGIIHISRQYMEIVGPKLNDLLPVEKIEEVEGQQQQQGPEIVVAATTNVNNDNIVQEGGDDDDDDTNPTTSYESIKFPIRPYYF